MAGRGDRGVTSAARAVVRRRTQPRRVVRWWSIMFRFTIRDVAAIALTAAAIVLIGAALFALQWRSNSPRSRVGAIRQGLEHISRESAKRDREIDELTLPHNRWENRQRLSGARSAAF